MCLPNFERFENITQENAVTGYRMWKNPIKDSLDLISEYRDHRWISLIDGPHIVLDKDSGLYSYNNYYYNYNYNNNYYNYYNNYNNYYNYYNNYNNYNYNNYNNYYNYYLGGLIKQWGKVAIHQEGYRSEYASVDTLFNIRESDAKGPEEFITWIKLFNDRINKIAEEYNCKIISWQDFKKIKK